MQLIDNEIFLDITEVTGACGLSEQTIYMGKNRGTANWQTIPCPINANYTLVRYKTLAINYQILIKSKYCDGIEPLVWFKNTQAKQAPVSPFTESLQKAFQEDYMGYLNLYRPDTEDEQKRQRQRRDLARAAVFVIAVANQYKTTKTPFTKHALAKEACDFVSQKKIIKEYGRPNTSGQMTMPYVPTNYRRLLEKVVAYANGLPIQQVIAQPRIGNENRLGENHNFAKGAVARLMTEGKNPTLANVIRKVQFLCINNNLSEPAEATIRRMAADMQSLTALKNYGVGNRAAQNFRKSVPLARAMNAGDCWELDGTRVQLQPYHTDGRLVYLYVVVVRDVYSGSYLGWSFGENESATMYREALRMAVTLSGYLPLEIKTDKFPGHNSDQSIRLFDSFKERGVRITTTSSATGKPNVERAFGTLQSVFELDRKEWVGQGIKSTREYNRPTAEYLNKIHKQLKAEGYTWEEAWRTENETLSLYNYTPINTYSKKFKNIAQSPIQLHETDIEQQKAEQKNIIKPVEIYEVATLFWTARKEKIRNFKIKLTVNKKEYDLELIGKEHYEITRNYKEVLVRFDETDMSEVMLFDCITNELLATVKPFDDIQLYGQNPEYDRLQEYKARMKERAAMDKETLQKITNHCDADVLSLTLQSILPKAVTEAAESSAMNQYYHNVVPIRPAAKVATKQTKTATPKAISIPKAESQTVEFTKHDAMLEILNQL